MFLKGLMNGGVPIKFATWNNYKSNGASNSVNIQIQERGRSVKSIFALQKRDTPLLQVDSGATFFSTGTTGTGGPVAAQLGANTLQEYQFRIGGRLTMFNADISLLHQCKTLLKLEVKYLMAGQSLGLS